MEHQGRLSREARRLVDARMSVIGADAAPVLQDAAVQLIRTVQFSTIQTHASILHMPRSPGDGEVLLRQPWSLGPYPGPNEGFVVLRTPLTR